MYVCACLCVCVFVCCVTVGVERQEAEERINFFNFYVHSETKFG